MAEFMRDRIRETVDDPAVAELLCPRGYPVGAKRLCQSDDYYAMFNRPNVTLVDIRSAPIESAYPGGLKTAADSYELDALVFATGFDALTGALFAMDIRGAGGVPLRSAWAAGAAGLPRRGRRRVPEHVHHHRAGVALGVHQHGAVHRAARGVDAGLHRLAAVARARDDRADRRGAGRVDGARVGSGRTRRCSRKADSWYVGANIPGKPRVFTSYLAGCGPYRAKCDAVAAAGYEGFALGGS